RKAAGGEHRRPAGVRRLRLPQGVSGREADAQREALPDLRRDVANTAARDRPRDLHAEGLTALRGADRLREPVRNTRRTQRRRVDAGVLGVPVRDELTPAHDRVLVAEAGPAQANAARVNDELVVEPRGSAVTAERLEDERLDALVAERLVAAGELPQVFDARHLEPDEVGRVVHDSLRVGVGEAD